jgi:AcrR family transcriptional regulator
VRTPRSDAVRNRGALLAAADAEFAEHGAAAASLSATAARAGVSIGTLYKHFPTRRALIGALLAERHDALFAAAAELDGAGLATWMRRLVAHAATYSGLADVLAAGGPEPPDGSASHADGAARLAADCAQMSAITHRLAEDARSRGLLRADTTVEDLLALAGAAAWACEHHGVEHGDRLLDAALVGFAG